MGVYVRHGRMKDDYISALLEIADNLPYMDYCRLMTVIYWNMI